jgi:FkbM family methyltransferase
MAIEIKPNLRLLSLAPSPDPVYQGWERAEMTALCRDSDELPKVPNAGEVQTLADGTRVQVMHNGVRVLADAYFGRWTTEIVRRLHGHHEPQEEKVFAVLLDRLRADGIASQGRPAMIELGCFWAYYSLWFRRVFPQGRSILIEPDPGHREIGRRNLALNGVESVVMNAAVGETPGEMEFLAESDGATRRIPVVSVDSLIDAFKLPELHILHADVQGAELAVLRGSERAVKASKIRFAVLSTHHHQLTGDPLLHYRCLDWLRDHGAHVVAEHSVAESFSGDGLIVASFRPADRDLHVEVSRNCPSLSLFRETEHDLAEAQEQIRALQAEIAVLKADPSGSVTRRPFWKRS